jgi:uracil-DNA glycosylase family 4
MSESNYVPGMGQYGAKIMILGECPTHKDVQAGRPFVDSRELDLLLKDARINKAECWLSNVFKEPIPSSPTRKKIPAYIRAEQAGLNITQSLNELQNEINGVRPNVIIGLGGTALWALTGIKPKGKKKDKDGEENKIRLPAGGITDYRGSILLGMGHKVVCTFNPAQLSWQAADVEFIGYYNRQIILADLKRAKSQSQFADLRLPQRQIDICKSLEDIKRFRNQYKNKIDMATDIEAGGHFLPACIGFAFSRSHAMVVPLWNINEFSYISDAEMAAMWYQVAEILYEKEIIGQNFNYDRDKIRRIGFIIRRLKSDIMLKVHAINPELPKNLAFNTSIYTEEPFYKNEGMYEGSFHDLLVGCGRDCCVTKEIDEVTESELDEIGQRSYFYNFMMTWPELYLRMENTGFKIDYERRDELIEKYVEWNERLQYELFQLTGANINANSPKQVSFLLFEELKMPVRNGTSEEELTSLLNLQSFTDPTARRIVELILEKRRVSKTISTYLMALPDYDGRMKTTYFPCLDTGRSKTGQQDPPIRPTIEIVDENGKKKKKSMGTAFQTMTKHGDIGQDVRSMYVPG